MVGAVTIRPSVDGAATSCQVARTIIIETDARTVEHHNYEVPIPSTLDLTQITTIGVATSL